MLKVGDLVTWVHQDIRDDVGIVLEAQEKKFNYSEVGPETDTVYKILWLTSDIGEVYYSEYWDGRSMSKIPQS